jgi:5-methylcytosine-specific restriction endonuclease McrA
VSSSQPWYGTKRWQIRRKQQLQQQPLCALCLQEHRVPAATVADHITPHKGDYNLFWHGPLQSLCENCHSRFKQRVEIHGYSNAVDVHGRPIDPNHPSNKFEPR